MIALLHEHGLPQIPTLASILTVHFLLQIRLFFAFRITEKYFQYFEARGLRFSVFRWELDGLVEPGRLQFMHDDMFLALTVRGVFREEFWGCAKTHGYREVMEGMGDDVGGVIMWHLGAGRGWEMEEPVKVWPFRMWWEDGYTKRRGGIYE